MSFLHITVNETQNFEMKCIYFCNNKYSNGKFLNIIYQFQICIGCDKPESQSERHIGIRKYLNTFGKKITVIFCLRPIYLCAKTISFLTSFDFRIITP